MQSSNLSRSALAGKAALGGTLLAAFGAGLAFACWFPRAQAAPATTASAPSPTSALAQQILGKAGPPETLSPDSIPSDYRLIVMIDAQARSGYYVTRGETMTIGPDTYLLAYQVNTFFDEAGVQKIARGNTLLLSLVNMHNIEIVSQMGPLPEVGTPPPPKSQSGGDQQP